MGTFKIKVDFWHPEDKLLDGMPFRELINTVICNEPKHDRESIERVFNEILAAKVRDAKEMFKAYYKNIKRGCK